MSGGGGSKLAKWAVGVLSVVVITQAVFLLSLMKAVHNEDSLGTVPSHTGAKSAAVQQSSSGSGNPQATHRSPGEHVLDASWAAVHEYLRHPHFPKRFEGAASSPPNLDGATGAATTPPGRVEHFAETTPRSRENLVVRRAKDGDRTRKSVEEPSSRAPLPALQRDSQPPDRFHAEDVGLSNGTGAEDRGAGMRSTRSPKPQHNAEHIGSHGSSEPEFVRVHGDVHKEQTVAAEDVDRLHDSVPAPTTLRALKDAAVVVLCYNRPALLVRTLASITVARLASQIPKYVSQDGDDEATRTAAHGPEAAGFTYLRHPRTLPPVQSGVLDDDGRPKETPATMYLAAHYRWVLDEVFFRRGHTHAIIFEDDMQVSHDVFEMFEALAPLLDVDPTLWCISSWNDNGFRTFDVPPDMFFRSSYFPGLGWLLKRSLWKELSPKFPRDNWDHWMRATTTSRHRECISPWRSRNYNMGVGGATSNQDFYSLYLEPIVLHRGESITYRNRKGLLNAAYFHDISLRVQQVPPANQFPAPTVTGLNPSQFTPGNAYLIHYVHEEYEMLAQMLGIHPTPRSSYRHSQWLKFQGADVFLVDRRLSPFIPADLRVHRNHRLEARPASRPGVSCTEVCQSTDPRSGSAASQCAADQFDFINDCLVLSQFFDGCRNGCTQGWGEDIPNTEVAGVGHTPMCLATEVLPTCEASFPFTQRLCPCVADDPLPAVVGGDGRPPVGPPHGSRESTGEVRAIPAPRSGTNCEDVCASHSETTSTGASRLVPLWCDPSAMMQINDCDHLRAAFPCASCENMVGSELPSYVSEPRNANFGKCFTSKRPSDCYGSHPDTRRLCPCALRSKASEFSATAINGR